MKGFVIFVLLFASVAHGDAKKVCILFEQKAVATTTTVIEPTSASTSESVSSVQEGGEITLGTDSSVQDDIVITLGSETETTEEITATEAASVPSIASLVSESTDICALEAITLFDDQNVSDLDGLMHYFHILRILNFHISKFHTKRNVVHTMRHEKYISRLSEIA